MWQSSLVRLVENNSGKEEKKLLMPGHSFSLLQWVETNLQRVFLLSLCICGLTRFFKNNSFSIQFVLELDKYFVKESSININFFSKKWFQPNVSIILNRFSPIYTEVRDQETRKELSRANFLISFPHFFATKYGRIIIQHCHGWSV